MAFSEREIAILGVIAETFVPGDGVARGRLAAEALEQVADPAQLLQLRLALRSMDSRVANLALAGRPSAIRSMSPEAAERYLLGWGTSALPMRRSAFQALRKLLTFLAYGGSRAPLTGGPGTMADDRLTRIGYVTDDPPVTPDLTPIVPVRPPAQASARGDPDMPWTLEADVVVVGSGAGGGVIAAELASAGRSVVVLEAGPFVDEATMPSSEIDAFDQLYLDHGLLTTWDGSVTMLAGSAVGGGTLINWMHSIDAPESVRAEWEREHGLEAMTGSAWDADVEAIEIELGVAESTHIPPKDAILVRGARALGWEAGPTRRDAAACGDCGRCPFGCRRGTKRSGIRAHLARAAAAGARIVPDARVDRIRLEGGRAVGVEGVVGDGSRRRFVVQAPVVVLAAGALRTPAILLRSGLDHPAIGRNLRLHPVPVVAGRFSERIDMWRGTMQAARSLEFSEPDGDRNGYVIESAPGHPGLMALALPWEGVAAHRALMDDSVRISPLIAVTRDGGAGHVRLTRAGGVRVDYALDAGGVATMRHALIMMARLLRAAGADEMVAVGTPPLRHRGTADFDRFERALAEADCGPNRLGIFSAHQMGSVRMGADRRDHACDPAGRVRRSAADETTVAGLYVGDGSVLPTGIGVNPMITIMAMARRRASRILAEA